MNESQPPAPELYSTLATYNRWMNQQLYHACAQLSDGERKRDRGAFFGSIHGTLNHLLFGDLAWLGRFIEQPLTSKAIGETLYEDFDDLRQARSQLDDRILTWTQTLTNAWLGSLLDYQSPTYGKARQLPRWLLVSHMFNHQTHHRGQLTTLLSQLGCDYGITDLPWMPSLEGIYGPDRPYPAS